MTGLRWSRRTTSTIAEELAKLGIAVSPNTVARLLHDMGYSLRVNQKQISTSSSPNRNLQFEYLAELRDRFQRRHLPIVSVDSKKRELVGNFKNPGRRWESAPRCVYDHDFRTDSIGVAIPYGIYDGIENRGALVVGVSHGIPSSIASSPQSRATGRANLWTPTRRSSTTPAPPKPTPVFRSLLISTADSILAVSNPLPIKWLPSDCSATKLCPSGTTRSSHNCELVLA